MKNTIKQIQHKVGVKADGIAGPVTFAAVAKALGIPSAQWPTQAEVRSGKSVFGAAGDKNLVNIVPPYPLYYEGERVKTIRVHKLIADAVSTALKRVLEHYGLERIHELGLDDYSGSYAPRNTTGGSSMSMHAWGIALDFAASENAMNTHAPEASLSRPECEEWWRIWESVGAVSMGRVYDKDWMHLQFANF